MIPDSDKGVTDNTGSPTEDVRQWKEPAALSSDRAILEQRARALAAPLLASTNAATEVITFSLNAEGYGIEVRYVYEVMRLNRIVPLPGLNTPFIGITNCHGHILPVIDLLSLFQTPQKTDPGKARQLIVLGQSKAELGVIVSAMGPVMSVAADSIVPPGAGRRTDHLVGLVPELGILADGDSLLSDPNFWINRT